jgi:sterol desaturase/sphingolipid hydroxylase (fatty acid hydroxylase superfamily)
MVTRYFIAFLTGSTVLAWLMLLFIGLTVERLCPAERGQPRWNIILNLAYSIVHSLANFALTPIAAAASAMAVSTLGGGFLVLPGAGWSLLWAIPLYLLATDFSDYLFHRAQHAWPFLWSMHSLHHSDTSVNITTAPRHFWVEAAIRILFVYSFVNLVLMPSPVILIAYGVAGYWNFVLHMNIRLSFGRFWPVLNSPQYHRIHHARDLAYGDRNFAALFPIYDVIFGTYYRPRKEEYPASGLKNDEAPSSLVELVAWPLFRYLRVRPIQNVSM